MKTLTLGVVGPLTGPSSNMGKGFARSAQFIQEKSAQRLGELGIELALTKLDDRGEASESLKKFEDCLRHGCVVSFGPCDTICAVEVAKNEKLRDMPILNPLATGSVLSSFMPPNMFRLTNPDGSRADRLVKYVTRQYPNEPVHVYILTGEKFSYARRLGADVVHRLDADNKVNYPEEFLRGILPKDLPGNREPIIVCSPSMETVALARQLRANGIHSQIFTFGSNSNLLTDAMVDSVTVCDLDRGQADATIREALEFFDEKYKDTEDPSLSTMNAVEIIVDIVSANAATILKSEVPAIRRLILGELGVGYHQGFTGTFTFDQDGEMVGPELLSTLRVARGGAWWKICRREYMFVEARENKKPQVVNPTSFRQFVEFWNTYYGFIVAIISLVGLVVGYFNGWLDGLLGR